MIQIVDKKLQELQTHTHAHVLRIVIANFVVECISRAKTLPLHLTGMGWWSDPTKYQGAANAIACAEIDQIGSRPFPISSWECKWKWQWKSTCRFLAGSHGREMENWCRYADWRPNLYHQIKQVSSLVAVPSDLPLPPEKCNEKEVRSYWEAWKSNIRSFT